MFILYIISEHVTIVPKGGYTPEGRGEWGYSMVHSLDNPQCNIKCYTFVVEYDLDPADQLERRVLLRESSLTNQRRGRHKTADHLEGLSPPHGSQGNSWVSMATRQ